jgi:D-alanyl-D-alanine dipeptidase
MPPGFRGVFLAVDAPSAPNLYRGADRRERVREPHSPREPGIGRLCRVPTVDNGEPLVDLRQECPGLVVIACPTFARASIARLLNDAQALLPAGHRLRVSTALRTFEQQADGYWRHFQKLQEQHPEWPLSILRRQANKFWHPPDTRAVPGHCTGGAVDVTLLGPDGEPLDMTSARREGRSTDATYSADLTETARAHRALLIRVMTLAGFSNCYDEWWHWSYGDAGWASRLNRPHALYGKVAEVPAPALRQIEERRRERERQAAAQRAEEIHSSPSLTAAAEEA